MTNRIQEIIPISHANFGVHFRCAEDMSLTCEAKLWFRLNFHARRGCISHVISHALQKGWKNKFHFRGIWNVEETMFPMRPCAVRYLAYRMSYKGSCLTYARALPWLLMPLCGRLLTTEWFTYVTVSNSTNKMECSKHSIRIWYSANV